MEKLKLIAFLSLWGSVGWMFWAMHNYDTGTDENMAITMAIAVGGTLAIHYLFELAIGLMLLPFYLVYRSTIWLLSVVVTIVSFGKYRRVVRIIEEEQLRHDIRKKINEEGEC